MVGRGPNLTIRIVKAYGVDMTINTAIILAAGLGTRMRPLTDTIPKPLVEVGGKPLLQYCLDALKPLSIDKAVVNVHYLPDHIISYLNAIPDQGLKISISDERDELLDSGGGTVNALDQIGPNPFLLLNADTFWLDDKNMKHDNLTELTSMFDENAMDILLMVVPISSTTGHTGGGDFSMDTHGRLQRFRGQNDDAIIYAGAAILNPKIFDDITDKKFSLNRCFDTAIEKDRLFGYQMKGHWITVGTMAAIVDAENSIKKHSVI